MKLLSIFTSIMLITTVSSATPIVLYDNNNQELGTSTNPVKVSFGTGDQYIEGNIGVGSSSPRGKLDVDGFIYGNGSQLNGVVSTSGYTGNLYGTGTSISSKSASYKNTITPTDGNGAFSTIRIIPFNIAFHTNINRVDGSVVNKSENGKLVEIAIYNSSLTRISTTGKREIPENGSFSFSFSNPQIAPGTYYLAFGTNSTTSTFTTNSTAVGYYMTSETPLPATLSSMTAATGSMPALTLMGDAEGVAPGFSYGSTPANIYVFGYDPDTVQPYGRNSSTSKICYSTNTGVSFIDLMTEPTYDSGDYMIDLLVLGGKIYILTQKLKLYRSTGLTESDTWDDISCPTTAGLRHSNAQALPYGFTGIFNNYIFIGEYSSTGSEFAPEGPRILRYDTVGGTWALSKEFAGARHIHAFYNAGVSIYASIGDAGYTGIGLWQLTPDNIGAGDGGTDAWTQWTSTESPHSSNYAVSIIAGDGNFISGIIGASDVVGNHLLFSKTSGTPGSFEFSPLIYRPVENGFETARAVIMDTTYGNIYYWTEESSTPALYVTFPPYVQTLKLKDLTDSPPVFIGRSVKSGQVIMNYNQRFTIPSATISEGSRENEPSLDDVIAKNATTSRSVSIGTTAQPNTTLDIGGVSLTNTNRPNTLGVKGDIEVDQNVYIDGRLLSASGNYAAPTYSFSEEPGMGMYRVTSNWMGFAINNAAVLQLKETGASASGYAIANHSNPLFYGIRFGSDGIIGWTDNINASSDVMDIGISRGASGKLYIGDGTEGTYAGTIIAGKIGLGLTSPMSKLHIDGAIYVGTTAPSHANVSLSTSGHGMFGGSVEIDGNIYADGAIYGTSAGFGSVDGYLYYNASTGRITVRP